MNSKAKMAVETCIFCFCRKTNKDWNIYLLQNMSELLGKQQKAKYFQQAKDGKYTMLCKSESSLENESTKQVDRMQALSAIVDRLNQEFPHVQPALRRVNLALSTRTEQAQD